MISGVSHLESGCYDGSEVRSGDDSSILRISVLFFKGSAFVEDGFTILLLYNFKNIQVCRFSVLFSNSCLICSFRFTYVYSITVIAVKLVDDVVLFLSWDRVFWAW